MSDPPEAGWFVGAVGTLLGAAGMAIGALFKINESKNTAAIAELRDRLSKESASLKAEIKSAHQRFADSDKQHEECRSDRENLRIEMATLRAQVQWNTEQK